MFDPETVPAGFRHQRSTVWPQTAYPSLNGSALRANCNLTREGSPAARSPKISGLFVASFGPERNAFPWAFVVKRAYFGLFWRIVWGASGCRSFTVPQAFFLSTARLPTIVRGQWF